MSTSSMTFKKYGRYKSNGLYFLHIISIIWARFGGEHYTIFDDPTSHLTGSPTKAGGCWVEIVESSNTTKVV